MSFTPFQHLLNKTAAHYGIIKEFKAVQVCAAFESLLPDLFPLAPKAKDHIRAKFYKGHVLTIGVPSSTWANEILTRKPQILEKLNAKIPDMKGKPVIKDIATQMG